MVFLEAAIDDGELAEKFIYGYCGGMYCVWRNLHRRHAVPMSEHDDRVDW